MAKIGSVATRFVTILSILSEVVKVVFLLLLRHVFIIEKINIYRSFVIMLSTSSSNSSSKSLISAVTSSILCIRFAILSSPSSSLTAKNRFCSFGISSPSFVITDAIARSARSSNTCIGIGGFFLAVAIASSTALETPVPFNAEIAIISQPNFQKAQQDVAYHHFFQEYRTYRLPLQRKFQVP